MNLVSLRTEAQGGDFFYKIGLSDGAALSLKPCYLEDYCEDPSSWETGKEFSPSEEEALRFAAACYKAEQAGMRLVGIAEQTRLGLTRKLEQRGHERACVQAVVSRLIGLDLVNDGRYAEFWLRSKLAKRGGKIPGPKKLSASLSGKGVDRDAISGAFAKVLDEEAEFALLERFLEKNHPQNLLEEDGYSLRGLLKSEGFSADVLNRYFER
ncbi:regulatory protein RecX [Leadbettera azotonutricia]|uniref:Regulatory protein RecX n=1 Tax=Leadbettera azotonutricia (strain ATCC BAA-888 / DSM 13862 / ZAS-9) TaxID=545695 RepID=F5YD42_LEAAZ|nr:regulatory protein RecX [Leadbettera azotonutricia]AEF80974.1 putative regulatory protein RecX [Leadbettera azotonutricia ZAS-9]